uniref:Uncharacterized protein n=2 Tax=Mycobacterium leprae TaxID=1769 RepID=Q49697_MYCLR|nr:hypothetical protein MLCL536.36 [Mycobacterium leprae]
MRRQRSTTRCPGRPLFTEVGAPGAELVIWMGGADHRLECGKAQLSNGADADKVLYCPEAAQFGQQIRALNRRCPNVAAFYASLEVTNFDANMAVRGTLALFRDTSGTAVPVDPQHLNAAGSLYLTRPTLANLIRTGEEFS